MYARFKAQNVFTIRTKYLILTHDRHGDRRKPSCVVSIFMLKCMEIILKLHRESGVCPSCIPVTLYVKSNSQHFDDNKNKYKNKSRETSRRFIETNAHEYSWPTQSRVLNNERRGLLLSPIRWSNFSTGNFTISRCLSNG